MRSRAAAPSKPSIHENTPRWFASLLAAWMALLPAAAQYDAPPPAPAAFLWSPQQLDQMFGAIALYPDPLVAQILPAATQPGQVASAAEYLRTGGDPAYIEGQPWDPSVRAVAHYPILIRWMGNNLAWTTQAGQAFVNQPGDVMNSIQRLRAQAMSYGNLISTPQQQVVAYNGMIEILPADPRLIYIPRYNPAYVYYQRPAPGAAFITFRVGFGIGVWLANDCDWYNHGIVVWGPAHPRPPGWWGRPPRERWEMDAHGPGRVGIRADVSVWRPHAVEPMRSVPHDVAPAHPAQHGPAGRPADRPPAPTVHANPGATAPLPGHAPRPAPPQPTGHSPAPASAPSGTPHAAPPSRTPPQPTTRPAPSNPAPAHPPSGAPSSRPASGNTGHASPARPSTPAREPGERR